MRLPTDQLIWISKSISNNHRPSHVSLYQLNQNQASSPRRNQWHPKVKTYLQPKVIKPSSSSSSFPSSASLINTRSEHFTWNKSRLIQSEISRSLSLLLSLSSLINQGTEPRNRNHHLTLPFTNRYQQHSFCNCSFLLSPVKVKNTHENSLSFT